MRPRPRRPPSRKRGKTRTPASDMATIRPQSWVGSRARFQWLPVIRLRVVASNFLMAASGALDWRSRKVRDLTQEQSKDHLWDYVAWSPDGKSIYANRANAGFTDADVSSRGRGERQPGKPNTSPRPNPVCGLVPLGRWTDSARDFQRESGIQ